MDKAKVSAALGESIAALRTAANISRAELGRRLKVSESSIGQYERGTRTPSFDTLYEMAEIFSVSLDVLCGRTAEDYDAVSEYRYEQAKRFVSRYGFEVYGGGNVNEPVEVIEKREGKTKWRFGDDGTLEIVPDENSLQTAISFRHGKNFTAVVESLMEQFTTADGGGEVVKSFFREIIKTGGAPVRTLFVRTAND